MNNTEYELIVRVIEEFKSEVSYFVEERSETLMKDLSVMLSIQQSPNHERYEVIEAAKQFVEDKFMTDPESQHLGRHMDLYSGIGIIGVIPEFHVNKEKRVVACLLKGAESSKIYGKAVAKTAPTDVFNVHIGEAISLARALGEKIPNEFYNAPQPKEAEVGDVVQVTEEGVITGEKLTLTKRIPSHDDFGKGKAFRHTYDSRWLGDKQFKIIDDSKE